MCRLFTNIIKVRAACYIWYCFIKLVISDKLNIFKYLNVLFCFHTHKTFTLKTIVIII